MTDRNEKLGYKHLETDVEFQDRILTDPTLNTRYWFYDVKNAEGDFLDTLVWEAFKRQRKIVEVFP